ncbi:hypothetical protein [Deinococcus aquaedulcis]|uniref:hypothetical protein n=1 Tax=Deinococcus aquaedulcis TaxID=2840455 RepID=UPI001C8301E3|nr:hypothetical protein [Deinococcus aquaedulcis]
MFWIQAGCPRLNPAFLAEPQPAEDLGMLIAQAYPLLAEAVIVAIDHQFHPLAYQDFSTWIGELVAFLSAIHQGQGSHTALHDQSSFDSDWTGKLDGENLHVRVCWDPFGKQHTAEFLVDRGHFLREWKEALMRVRTDLAPFVYLLQHKAEWDALVRLTDEIGGRGMLYGGVPEWELSQT